MNWSHFLIAIRWQNVFIIWLMQSVVFFRYVLPYCGHDNYSFASFILLLIATGSVLGGGNIYNDIRDISTDALHTDPSKPGPIGVEISIPTARNWYFTLSGIPVLIVVAGMVFYSWPVSLAIIIVAGIISLYLYSTHLKSTILTGNLLVAALCAVSVWMTTLLLPGCKLGITPDWEGPIPVILYGYIANAFMVTLLREIVKDKEDAPSDISAGIYTIGSLPEKSFYWTFNGILLIITTVNAFWFFKLKSMMTAQSWNLGILFIFIPLVIIALIFNLPHKPKVYPFLSKLIKVYILFAILLLVLWQKF